MSELMGLEPNFDEEAELSLVLANLHGAVQNPSGKSKSLLEKSLARIDEYLKHSYQQEEYSEIYIDVEYEISEVLNGGEFRSDVVGDQATQDTEILSLIHKYICPHNENVEVVLASNPNISESLKWELAGSEFEWEEDGTRETLARNTLDPKLLAHLSEVGNDNVKHQVALNQRTSIEVLDRLIHETGQCNFQMEECLFGELTTFRGFIRWAVVQNPNAQVFTLEKVTKGELVPINKEADFEIFRSASERLTSA
jgi:hypothetical protein